MDKRHFIQKRTYRMNDGKEFAVNIYQKYSGRGMTIRTVYGEMEVYVAPGFTYAGLDAFVKKVYEKYPEKIIDRPFMKEGVYIYLLGKKKYFTSDPTLKDNERYFYVPSTMKDPLVKYKKLFLDYAKERTVEIGKRMGKDLTDFTIRTALFLTYYGCCFPTKQQIKYDYRLFAFKPEISDSVIVHEIAHTYEIHHNDRFYKIVKCYCPDYDKLEKEIQEGRFEGELDNYVF